jgi:hypothetical protein
VVQQVQLKVMLFYTFKQTTLLALLVLLHKLLQLKMRLETLRRQGYISLLEMLRVQVQSVCVSLVLVTC